MDSHFTNTLYRFNRIEHFYYSKRILVIKSLTTIFLLFKDIKIFTRSSKYIKTEFIKRKYVYSRIVSSVQTNTFFE